MGNLQQRWSTKPVVLNRDIFDTNLFNYGLVDVGYIKELFNDGQTANVVTPYEILQCEVVSVGYDDSVVVGARPGQYCLVFIPRSPISILEGTFDTEASNYSKLAAKCLPIGIAKGQKVAFSSDDTSVSVSAPNYNLVADEHEVKAVNKEFCVRADMEGKSVSVSVGTDIKLKVSSAGVSIKAGNTVDSSTGELTESKTVVTVAPDGSVAIQASDVSLQSDSISLQADEVELDGDVKITGALDVADGTFTVDKPSTP